eukprot:7980527-Pyramimonas_sp.AAC.1
MGQRTVLTVHQNRAASPCGPCHWGLRRSSLWGHEPCDKFANMGRRRHVDPATEAFGGTPMGLRTV